MEKIFETKKFDPKCSKEFIENILNTNIDNLSDKQTKMLCDLYFENLRDGLKPKEAMDKAFEIVTCFKIWIKNKIINYKI